MATRHPYGLYIDIGVALGRRGTFFGVGATDRG